MKILIKQYEERIEENMKYINKLQMENSELKNRLKTADIIIIDLYRYLHSEKFHVDNTVNVNDIFNRLDDIRFQLSVE